MENNTTHSCRFDYARGTKKQDPDRIHSQINKNLKKMLHDTIILGQMPLPIQWIPETVRDILNTIAVAPPKKSVIRVSGHGRPSVTGPLCPWSWITLACTVDSMNLHLCGHKVHCTRMALYMLLTHCWYMSRAIQWKGIAQSLCKPCQCVSHTCL